MNSKIKKLLVLILLLIVVSYQHSSVIVPNQKPVEKVILISIDTLRADYLGSYGAEMKVSPNLDRFADENILFTDATSQAPSTAISHKSLLYSLYPAIHKTSSKIKPEEQLISPLEAIQQNGFKTAAFVGGGELSRDFGFSKGFDSYWEAGIYSDSDSTESLEMLERNVSEWLERNYNQKFFLFIHSYEMHCPYFPPKQYRDRFAGWYTGDIDPKRKCGDNYYNLRNLSPEDVKFIRDLYSAQLAYIDDFVGTLFEKLKSLKIYSDTLIIFLSDHGESLGERGYIGHNQLYQTQLRIPLIFHIPGKSTVQIDKPVEAVDVMPTIFHLLKLKAPYRFQGRSLLSVIFNPITAATNRILFSEQSGKVRVRKDQVSAIFDHVNDNVSEVYNLRKDPNEGDNLAGTFFQFVKSSRLEYLRMTKTHADVARRFVVGDFSTPIVDTETLEQLKGLGYLR